MIPSDPDLIIIAGQGIAGSVLAHTLRKAGKHFIVIDNQDLSRSSRVAPGIWNPVVFKRMTKSWRADEVIPAMHSFFSEAESFLGKKIITKRKLLKYFTEKQEADLWMKKYNSELGSFIEGRIYSPEEFNMNGVTPPEYGFSFVTESGNVDTVEFISSTRQWLRSEGLLIEETLDHSKLKVDSSGINYGNIKAGKLVFCEGWLARLNPYFSYVPFKPAKGEVFTFQCPELKMDDILIKNVFVLRLNNGEFKCGASYEWEELNDEITENKQEELESNLKKLLKLPFEITGRQAGVRPSVIDRRPVLGGHPTEKNIFIFNGLGTKAVMLAPFFATEMSNFINGTGTLSDEVNVNRFKS